LFVWPLFARAVAANLHLPLTPLLMLGLYAVVLRRVADPNSAGAVNDLTIQYTQAR